MDKDAKFDKDTLCGSGYERFHELTTTGWTGTQQTLVYPKRWFGKTLACIFTKKKMIKIYHVAQGS